MSLLDLDKEGRPCVATWKRCRVNPLMSRHRILCHGRELMKVWGGRVCRDSERSARVTSRSMRTTVNAVCSQCAHDRPVTVQCRALFGSLYMDTVHEHCS